jgi:photosystem II stability/assembly factor-like uncharacterized protein
MKDTETALRATLIEAEAKAPAPRDLADRLIAATTSPSRATPHVVPLRARTVTRRWLPPLLAAAAIVVAVTAGVVVRSSLSSSPAPRPAHHTPRPLPTVTFPSGFSALSVRFNSAEDGWAIGDGASGPRPHVAILRTHDGGVHWSTIPTPPVTVPAETCRESGDTVSGSGTQPCVDGAVFADDQHGYAWGFHTFFSTVDGGRTWRSDPVHPSSVIIAGHDVIRIIAAGKMMGPSIVQVAAVGSAHWQTVTPGGGGTAETSQLVASGKVAYYLATHYPTGGVLFRSGDAGESWTKVNDAPCGPTVQTASVTVAPDGTLAASCYGGAYATIRVSSDGGRTFGADRIAPGTRKTSQSQQVAVVAPVSAKVLLLRVGDRQPGHTYRRSTDGGKTWQVVGTDDAMQSIFGWQMFDARHGYRTAPYGAGLLTTSDGGRTWTPRTFNP